MIKTVVGFKDGRSYCAGFWVIEEGTQRDNEWVIFDKIDTRLEDGMYGIPYGVDTFVESESMGNIGRAVLDNFDESETGFYVTCSDVSVGLDCAKILRKMGVICGYSEY